MHKRKQKESRIFPLSFLPFLPSERTKNINWHHPPSSSPEPACKPNDQHQPLTGKTELHYCFNPQPVWTVFSPLSIKTQNPPPNGFFSFHPSLPFSLSEIRNRGQRKKRKSWGKKSLKKKGECLVWVIKRSGVCMKKPNHSFLFSFHQNINTITVTLTIFFSLFQFPPSKKD